MATEALAYFEADGRATFALDQDGERVWCETSGDPISELVWAKECLKNVPNLVTAKCPRQDEAGTWRQPVTLRED